MMTIMRKYYILIIFLLFVSHGVNAQTEPEVQVYTVGNLIIRIEHHYNSYMYMVKYVDESIGSGRYSAERYGSTEHYKQLYQLAWHTAIEGLESDTVGRLFSDYMIRKKIDDRGFQSGYLVVSVTKTGFVYKYALGFKGDNVDRQLFSFDDCEEVFQLLNDSVFHPWSYDIDDVRGGAIGFKLLRNTQ